MIKSLQSTVHPKDPKDWRVQAINLDNKLITLCDINFKQHPILNEELMGDIVERVFGQICKAIPQYNEDQHHPTEAERRRANAATRKIIRKLGMRPIL